MTTQTLNNIAEINGRHYRIVDRTIKTTDVAFIPLDPGYNFVPLQVYKLTGFSGDNPLYPMGIDEDGDEDGYPGSYRSLENISEYEIVSCLTGCGFTAEELTEKLFPYAKDYVIRTKFCSVSGIQRHLRTGYILAARLVDALEAKGVVGPYTGIKPREILAKEDVKLYETREKHSSPIYLHRSMPEDIIVDKIKIWRELIAQEQNNLQVFTEFETDVVPVSLLLANKCGELEQSIEAHEKELAGFLEDAILMGVEVPA